jgi:hypothetical protein
MRTNRFAFFFLFLGALLVVPNATADDEKGFPLEGEWKGTLVIPEGELPVVFHITRNEDDTFTATMDSPAQEAFGIPIDSVDLKDHTVRIWSEALQGGFTADLDEDKPDEIAGTWEQMGHTLPLTITRVVEESS